MKYASLLVAGLALSGCVSQVPDSGFGVTDATLEQDRLAREAALTGFQPPEEVTATTLDGAAMAQTGDAGAPLSALDPGGAAPAPIGADVAPGGISDEQDFDAVSSRETIESDAERLERNMAQYTLIEPTELPRRPDGRPNIIGYALATQHPVGTQLYRRLNFMAGDRHLRNCASFSTADRAQEWFLANGGPNRDRRALDPDGDGFACAWDPTPFRVAITAPVNTDESKLAEALN